MLFMNEWDVQDAADRYAGHALLGPATRTLRNLVDAANCNSDGWAYWPKPCRAARKLQALIQGDGSIRYDSVRADVTAAAVKAAYGPIKAFRTRSGIDFDIIAV